MSRIEVLNRQFFPIPALWVNGIIVPAPKEAVKEYCELRNGWLRNHPTCPHEIPAVSLCPGKEEGKDGYFVRTEIMYR